MRVGRFAKDGEGRVFVATEAISDLNWRLRYAPDTVTREDMLVLASMCSELGEFRRMTQRQMLHRHRVWRGAGVNEEAG